MKNLRQTLFYKNFLISKIRRSIQRECCFGEKLILRVKSVIKRGIFEDGLMLFNTNDTYLAREGHDQGGFNYVSQSIHGCQPSMCTTQGNSTLYSIQGCPISSNLVQNSQPCMENKVVISLSNFIRSCTEFPTLYIQGCDLSLFVQNSKPCIFPSRCISLT